MRSLGASSTDPAGSRLRRALIIGCNGVDAFGTSFKLAKQGVVLYTEEVPRSLDHQSIDRANQAADHLIAQRLRRKPGLLRAARRNLARWMVADGDHSRPVFMEWHGVLDRLTRKEIANFLMSDTPKARRLRQSSPFMGLLTKNDIRRLRESDEKGRS